MQIDESQYVDAPSGSRAAAAGGASPAADGPGGGDDEQDRNKRIAAVMRDTSLTAAERNAKIQAIRTGNAFSVQAPAGGHDAGDGESNGGGESGGARADAGDAAERNKRIAAVMRPRYRGIRQPPLSRVTRHQCLRQSKKRKTRTSKER